MKYSINYLSVILNTIYVFKYLLNAKIVQYISDDLICTTMIQNLQVTGQEICKQSLGYLFTIRFIYIYMIG